MLSLHSLASGALNGVFPMKMALVKKCTGVKTNPDYSRVPTYVEYPEKVRVAALSARELEHMYDQNVQGILQKVFLSGFWEGVDRRKSTGGDLIVIDGVTWLIVEVLAAYPTWSAVCVQKQVDP
jgi:hypothetical protein